MQLYKILIRGIVQGVGFRPYIYRKAKQYGLVGSVKNTGSGVEIIVNDNDFMKKIMESNDLPPLAKISEFSNEKIIEPKKTRSKIKNKTKKTRYSDFKIIESGKNKDESSTIIPADIYMCEDCKNELNDKTNRRHNYYFITCTNCGPRFSITKDYPYDRKTTTMNKFPMCKDCRREYTNPDDRRYHSETIACKKCGPKLKLFDMQAKMQKNKGKNISGKNDADTIKRAAKIILSGEVIAIKGVGGFHLCAKISSVGKIRFILNRPNKPFAILARDVGMAKKFAIVSKSEKELLESPKRPVVVLQKKNGDNKDSLRESLREVSELNSIGVMLPYTALHHLLFNHIDEPIVMTSYNIPGEPMIIDEKTQIKQLTNTNNLHPRYVLTHERKVENRCDDSVIKIISETPIIHAYLRRSRGFVPMPINIQSTCKDTVAVGAELNNVMAVAKDKQIFLSQYVGETSKLKTLEFLKDANDKLIKLTRAKPRLVVCDLHPGYNSTQYARELAKKYNRTNKKSGTRLVQIQHHHAHIASVAAEHDLKNYVGIAMDGLGYGEDGNVWGGEVFLVEDGIKFKRVGHLEEQIQIGGDSASLNPKKMLFGILAKFMSEKELIDFRLFNEKETRLYSKQSKEKFNTITTTSTGRVLDAAAALLGICEKRTYDGRPAMLLESLAGEALPYNLECIFERKDKMIVLMTTPLFLFLIKNMNKDKRRLAATVQAYLSKGLFMIANEYSRINNINHPALKLPIVFSGGVAYNKMISKSMLKNGILMNLEVPCGDGGIAFGQAYLANLMYGTDTTKD